MHFTEKGIPYTSGKTTLRNSRMERSQKPGVAGEDRQESLFFSSKNSDRRTVNRGRRAKTGLVSLILDDRAIVIFSCHVFILGKIQSRGAIRLMYIL